MSTLAHQRCRNHAGREAVARCPECKRYFCRECITEHDDRVICATCLANLAEGRGAKRWRISGVVQAGQFALGLFLLWSCFYVLGRVLLNVPTEFHEQSIWAEEPRGYDGNE